MLRAIVYLEARDFLLRGSAVFALGLVVLSTGYAGWSGDRWRDSLSLSLEEFAAAEGVALQKWRSELAGIEKGEVEPSPSVANPMGISFPAVLRPGSLGDFASGHTDLLPQTAVVSPWRNVSDLFGRYQFDNPQSLAVGSFDVALVVVVLMPLLMIGISFDVLARERARGSLTVVLCAPVPLARFFWVKLLFRNGVLWLGAVLTMFALLLLNDAGGDRAARFAWWVGVSLAYGGLWLAMIAFVAARLRHATQVAATLAGLWFLFTFAIPGTVSTATEAAYPTPSRLALLSDIRSVQGATNRDLASVTDQFLFDHPELTVGDEGVPSFYRAAFLSNHAASESTAPIVEAFGRARSERAQALDWAQYLSPAIATQRILIRLAGADLGRQHRFQEQTQQALADLSEAVGPAVVSRNRITVSEFDELPPFTFVDRTLKETSARFAGPLFFLVLIGAALAVAAHQKLKNEEPWT